MEIHTHVGNLLDVQSGIIVHGCNCMGVMGSGIAKEVKDKYPKVFKNYSEHLKVHGTISRALGTINSNTIREKYPKLIIVNAFTQLDYGRDKDKVYVDYEAISKCFTQIKSIAEYYDLDVHFPLIGCGLANGDWPTVKFLIKTSLGPRVRKHLWVLTEKDLEGK